MDTKHSYPDAPRSTCKEEGLAFQDFVADLLMTEIGFPLTSYCSKQYQWKKGENRQGVEIKLDTRMAGPTATPYISFEVAEKSKAANPHWIDSGIMRDDNTWLYVQGNYHLVMVFGKEILRMVYKKTYAAKTWEPYPTIRTFLMPMTEARKIALKVFEIEPIDTAK